MSGLNGTVTITAKVGKDQAEAALKELGRVAKAVQVDVASGANAAAEAARRQEAAIRAQADAVKRQAEQTHSIRTRLEEEYIRATQKGATARIYIIEREHETQARAIKALGLRRREELELLTQNAETMEARITRVTIEEAEKRARAAQQEAEKAKKAREESVSKAFGGGISGSVANTLGISQEMAQIATRATMAAAAIGLVTAAVVKVHQALEPARQEAGNYEAAMKTLQVVSERTGASFEQARGTVKKFSDDISSPTAVMQAVRVFQTMGISAETQTKLISGMRDGLVAMGMDVNEQMPLMALAIKRQESALLDNMGVVSTIEQMYKNYAKELGTTVDKLDQAQREQAVVNGVLKETATYTGVAKEAADTYNGSLGRLNSAKKELARVIGEQVNPLYRDLNNLTADLITNTAKLIEKLAEIPEAKSNADRKVNDWLAGQLGRGVAAVAGEKAGDVVTRAFTNPKTNAFPFPTVVPSNFQYGPGYGKEGDAAQIRADKAAADARQKAEDEQRKKDEELRKERERKAKQAAEDQARLAQDLQSRLLTAGKDGFDRQRGQQEAWYREQKQRIEENAKTSSEAAKAKNKMLQDLERIHAEEMRKINDAEAKDNAARAKREADEAIREAERAAKELEQWQARRNGMRVDKYDLPGMLGRARAANAGARAERESALAQNLLPGSDLETPDQVSAEISRLDTLAKQSESVKDQAAYWGRIVQLTGQQTRMEKDILQARVQAGMQFGQSVGNLAAMGIQGGASRGDGIRGGANAIASGLGVAAVGASGTIAGLPAGIALGVAAAGVSLVGMIAGAVSDSIDKESAKKKAELESHTALVSGIKDYGRNLTPMEQLEKAREASLKGIREELANGASGDRQRELQNREQAILNEWGMAATRLKEAAEEQKRVAAQNMAQTAYRSALQTRIQHGALSEEMAIREQVKNGTLTQAEADERIRKVQTEAAKQSAIADAGGRREAFIDQTAGILAAGRTDEASIYRAKSEASQLWFMASGGDFGAMNERFGSGLANAATSAWEEYDLSIKIAEMIAKRDAEAPGASADRPLFTVVTNFKDAFSFMQESGYYRSGGPGTSRQDGFRGRAINTGRSI